MKHTFTAAALFMLVVLLFPVTAGAQQGKLIVLSPKVGTEIDTAEAAKYDLFGTVPNFHSAQCYQREDGTFIMLIRRRSADDGAVDSAVIETYRSLTLMADRIDHSELLKRGEYELGSDIPTLAYEDGSPVSADGPVSGVTRDARMATLQADSMARRSAGVSRQTVRNERNNLPLARPLRGMERPEFKTFDFVVSLGTSMFDVKGLSELLEVGGGTRVHAGFHLALHLSDEYRVRWMAGGTFSPDVSEGIEFNTFSTTILWRVIAYPPISPLLGIGAARSYYLAENSGVIVRAEYTYPTLALGLSIEHPKLDIIFTYSRGDMSTVFEKTSYTISLAGPSVQIMLSL